MTFAEQAVEEYLSNVASAQVAPSAGATAAITGALGAALCEMVCLHTGEAASSRRLAETTVELEDLRDQLLALADEDGAAVDEVQTAFEGDTDSTHEQAVLRRATEIPLRIAETAGDVATHATVVAADGTPNGRTDAVVGAIIARAAVASAAAIVRANTGLLADESVVSDIERRLDAAEVDAEAAVAELTEADG
jgi:formiminotetrahydrofolate cyclodeaminase